MSEKEISKGEFRSVCQAVGGINAMINEDCKDKDALALVKYISEDQKEEKLLANQQVIKTPIVRNGKQATVGYAPEVWKGWAWGRSCSGRLERHKRKEKEINRQNNIKYCKENYT